MAFSLRKMLSNITYFKKPDECPDISDNEGLLKRRHTVPNQPVEINFETTEPDSTSRQCISLNIPKSVKSFAAKKGSLSDTDILNLSIDTPLTQKRKRCKKLRVDIKKASNFMNDRLNCSQDEDSYHSNVENTPKHIHLECKSSDVFSEKFRVFDFSTSFDIFDDTSVEQSALEENFDVESLSDYSDTNISITSKNNSTVKMCRKVEVPRSDSSSEENHFVPSATPESFADVESGENEEKRLKLLLNYEIKLEKIKTFLKNMLNEFQFHTEVTKIFCHESVQSTCPDEKCSISPVDSWNVIMEKEDDETKTRVKEHLMSIKQSIEEFIQVYFQNFEVITNKKKIKKYLSHNRRMNTFGTKKGHCHSKRMQINNKKKLKHYDFPDLREAMISLFDPDSNDMSLFHTTIYSDTDESVMSKCRCDCHHHTSSSSHTDSGLTDKTNEISNSNQSITSSIGNFTLDSSAITAYSESLDQLISYNSFQDTSILSQKGAVERIKFYVQVHSIQIKCDVAEDDNLSNNSIYFYCPSCKYTNDDENSLLKHILSQSHCEKIHFLYKTSYIKKCVSAGKEIQPSTVLNPMKMYRDNNKIVCFGDAMYACSLCFENLIIGESMLMAHCAEKEHMERRERLCEMLD